MGFDKELEEAGVDSNNSIRRSLAAAKRMDRAAAKKQGLSQVSPGFVVNDKGEMQQLTQNYAECIDEWMHKLKIAFTGKVMNRSHKSKDWQGKPLNGLHPIIEQMIVVPPCELDEQAEAVLQESVKEGYAAGNERAVVSVSIFRTSFFSSIARASASRR